MPPSVEALLRAGSTCSEADERALLQRAAVIGREFRTAPSASSLRPSGGIALGSPVRLVREGLVRPIPSAPGGEEAFRFHHVLVRDVAYNGLSKADRARLHERHADWLDGETDAPDEIVGYHLEQAYRYRADGAGPEPAREVARRGRRRAARSRRHALVEERRRAGDDQPPRPGDIASSARTMPGGRGCAARGCLRGRDADAEETLEWSGRSAEAAMDVMSATEVSSRSIGATFQRQAATSSRDEAIPRSRSSVTTAGPGSQPGWDQPPKGRAGEQGAFMPYRDACARKQRAEAGRASSGST